MPRSEDAKLRRRARSRHKRNARYHAIMRAKQRFGIHLTDRDYAFLCDQIGSICKESKGRYWYDVDIGIETFVALWDADLKRIVSFLRPENFNDTGLGAKMMELLG